jgi:hypothetical protein
MFTARCEINLQMEINRKVIGQPILVLGEKRTDISFIVIPPPVIIESEAVTNLTRFHSD